MRLQIRVNEPPCWSDSKVTRKLGEKVQIDYGSQIDM